MTAFKSILVHLDSSPRCTARLRLAHQLAELHDAAVTALYAATPADLQFPFGFGPGMEAASVLRDLEATRRDRARTLFNEAVASGLYRLQWAELTREQPLYAFAQRALYADLMVLGQHEAHQERAQDVPPDFVESTLIDSGKPALVLPFIGTPSLPIRNVLVAWKESRESARALASALPLLQSAEHVHVACWGRPASGTAPVLAYLQQHGVSAQLHHYGEATPDIGELLLSLASDLDAGMLVMGCYGHSRAREWVLGGVSRTVLSSMTVPVLTSH